MRSIRPLAPPFEGQGELRFSGYAGEVQYKIQGDPVKLKPGPLRLRGSFTVDAETAADAFRAGEAILVASSGETYRLTMLGHTSGGGEVFVEFRV